MTSSNRRKSSESGPSQLLGARLLIVEDSWEVGTQLKAFFESCGAEVIGPAATANDARRLISESRPDIALVDINLRGGELSYELIDEMHALEIAIVVITGFANTSPATDKAVAVLQKPFTERELLAAVRSVRRS
jgi:DNA-binding response OmpR family regulator